MTPSSQQQMFVVDGLLARPIKVSSMPQLETESLALQHQLLKK
jgi:hypothetical protein